MTFVRLEESRRLLKDLVVEWTSWVLVLLEAFNEAPDRLGEIAGRGHG